MRQEKSWAAVETDLIPQFYNFILAAITIILEGDNFDERAAMIFILRIRRATRDDLDIICQQ